MLVAGSALVKCGQAQQKLGQAERDYLSSTANNFLQPLKAFLDGDMKTVQVTRLVHLTKDIVQLQIKLWKDNVFFFSPVAV